MIITTNSYDVDAPEGSSAPAATAFITLRDWKTIGVVVLVLFAVSVPIFQVYKAQRDEQVCKTSLNGIYKAMMQYAAQNDDRFPPLYSIGENTAPNLFKGKPLVWASMLGPYMNKRDSFTCPSSEPEEAMPAIGSDGRKSTDIDLTYGMYVAMGAAPYGLLSQPTATALLLETSNNGSMGSFNPMPFVDLNGKVVPFDAFMAGYDDSNEGLTKNSKWITRLAFRNARGGYNNEGVQPRHSKGIHVIYVDGHLGRMRARLAEVENIFPDAEGTWRVR